VKDTGRFQSKAVIAEEAREVEEAKEAGERDDKVGGNL
jgi:hypothetical protein